MTLSEESADWEPWVIFFFCLKKQKDNLSKKLERERILADTLPQLSVIFSLLREHRRLTISDLERLTGGNKNTLKVRLRELITSRHITRQGKARATWYALSSRAPSREPN